MIQRHLRDKLLRDASQYPVVTLTGPRQSGKTTLVRDTFPDYAYVSLEAPDHRAYALEDPRGFLKQFANKPVILDEAQRTPDLFSYIQGIVDENDISGQYVLTGSQNFLLSQQVGQSLAGRSSILHLLPFSHAELIGEKTMPLEMVGRVKSDAGKDESDLYQALHTGFFPRIHDKKLEPQDWLRNYYQTYLERDVRNLVNVGDIEIFARFVRLCAGRTGQLVNMSSLAADCGVSHTTVRRWLSTLEASFTIYLLLPHYRNFNKRLVKSPKLYFLDTGLLCYLLRIRTREDLIIHSSRGAIFETFVLSELLKAAWNQGVEPDVYFWRDAAGNEIDFLLDHGNTCIPIEAKSGETLTGDFFQTITYWRNLAGDEKMPAALVYGGETSAIRKDIMVYSWRHWLIDT